jgi:hypothetical protein
MAVAATGAYEEEIGGLRRRLVLRNGEIERFEVQHAPFGVFALWDQLFGHGNPPQVRHVRDLIALGLIGGGMADRAADDLVAGLPPSENLELRRIAQRLLGVTFLPAVLGAEKKSEAGSDGGGAGARGGRPGTTPAPESQTSAA